MTNEQHIHIQKGDGIIWEDKVVFESCLDSIPKCWSNITMYQNVDERFFTSVARKKQSMELFDQCVSCIDTSITNFSNKESGPFWYLSPSNIHVEMRMMH